MNWIKKLCDVYDAVSGNPDVPDSHTLTPLGWAKREATIEVVIDASGNFKRASSIPKKDPGRYIVIPVTEDSDVRSVNPCPHPLSDKIQYCDDNKNQPVESDKEPKPKKKKKEPPNYIDLYLKNLKAWSESEFTHPKVQAVYQYVSKKSLVRDLLAAGIPEKGLSAQVLRWVVEIPGDPNSDTWTDVTLHEAWQKYRLKSEKRPGICYVTGLPTDNLQVKHPAGIRYSGDHARLISSNSEEDAGDFTFQGRFLNKNQCLSISSETTQKAHLALNWLINRKNAYRRGGLVYVIWRAVTPDNPNPIVGDPYDFSEPDSIGDVGQGYATRLRKKISGYSTYIQDSDEILILGLDSAQDGQGRLAVIFFQSVTGSDFLNQVETWHKNFAWAQFGKTEDNPEKHAFVAAPKPNDIIEAAYGEHIADPLFKATLRGILPCIIQAVPFPRNLTEASIQRASNRVSFSGRIDKWEGCLRTACALYKGTHKEENYTMSLDQNRKTRDYLYGRLLAVAEAFESAALNLNRETRPTNASRMMQPFASKPFETWRNLESALTPYKVRLQTRSAGLYTYYARMLEEITASFEPEDFINNKPLSGEYLLGYYCQRQFIYSHKEGKQNEDAQQ